MLIAVLLLSISPLLYALEDRIEISKRLTKVDILNELAKVPAGKAKFAVSGNVLSISTTGKKSPKHDELVNNGEVVTGGYVYLEYVDTQLVQVTVDNYSGRLCPTFVSLKEVMDYLAPVIDPEMEISFKNNPNTKKCE